MSDLSLEEACIRVDAQILPTWKMNTRAIYEVLYDISYAWL